MIVTVCRCHTEHPPWCPPGVIQSILHVVLWVSYGVSSMMSSGCHTEHPPGCPLGIIWSILHDVLKVSYGASSMISSGDSSGRYTAIALQWTLCCQQKHFSLELNAARQEETPHCGENFNGFAAGHQEEEEGPPAGHQAAPGLGGGPPTGIITSYRLIRGPARENKKKFKKLVPEIKEGLL